MNDSPANDTSRMIALMRQLKVEMNGAVVGAMEDRGVNYPLNYGVSLPTIRTICQQMEGSHSLAELLYQQQVRELRLAAAFIDRSEWITPAQMEAWAESFDQAEVVEVLATFLFGDAPDAEAVALRWLLEPEPLKGYCALLMLLRILYNTPEQSRQNQLWSEQKWGEHLTDSLLTHPDSALIHRGAARLIERIALDNTALQEQIKGILDQLAQTTSPALLSLSQELRWCVEME